MMGMHMAVNMVCGNLVRQRAQAAAVLLRSSPWDTPHHLNTETVPVPLKHVYKQFGRLS